VPPALQDTCRVLLLMLPKMFHPPLISTGVLGPLLSLPPHAAEREIARMRALVTNGTDRDMGTSV